MDFQPRCARRAEIAIWAVIAATAATVCSFAIVGPFRIDWESVARVAAAAAALYAAGRFYQKSGRDLRAAGALIGTAQLALFAVAGAALSYVAAAADLPLWDEAFAASDRALGLNWAGWLTTMNAHPALHTACLLAYSSFPLQATAAILVLAATQRLVRLQVFLLGFMVATILTVVISAVMPAQGVWGHLGLSTQDYPAIAPATQNAHLPVFFGLRDGSFRLLAGAGAEGIITFPSLHAALAVLFIIAMWPLRYLRWIAVALNVTMLAATPVDGGHYFIDVLAGSMLAVACWWLTTRAIHHSAVSPLPVATTAPPLVPDQGTGTAGTSPTFEGTRSDTERA